MKHCGTDLTCVNEKHQSDGDHGGLHLTGSIRLVIKFVSMGAMNVTLRDGKAVHVSYIHLVMLDRTIYVTFKCIYFFLG